MNKEQFIYWLKGYTAGHEHAPTLKQWETIVSELDKIKDCPDYGSPIDSPNIIPSIWNQPLPINSYKLTCTTGSGATYSGVITNGNTTWTNIAKGANVNYTTNQLELDLE
jgi:hypothetical protein